MLQPNPRYPEDFDTAHAWRGGELLTPRRSGPDVLSAYGVLHGWGDIDGSDPEKRHKRKDKPRVMTPARRDSMRRYDERQQAAHEAEWKETGPHYCQCGCGVIMQPGPWRTGLDRRFLRGHNARVKGWAESSGYYRYHQNRKDGLHG